MTGDDRGRVEGDGGDEGRLSSQPSLLPLFHNVAVVWIGSQQSALIDRRALDRPTHDPGSWFLSPSPSVVVKLLTVKLLVEPPHGAPHGVQTDGREPAKEPKHTQREDTDGPLLIGPEHTHPIKTLLTDLSSWS